MNDKRREFAVLHGCSPFKTNPWQPNLLFGVGLPVLGITAVILLVLCSHISIGAGAVMAIVPPGLVAKRNELVAKSEVLGKVFEAAGSEVDLSKVKKIGEEDCSTWSTRQKAEKIKSLNDELTDLGKEVEALAGVGNAQDTLDHIKGLREPQTVKHPKPGAPGSFEIKTLGELVCDTPQFKSMIERGRGGEKGPMFLELDVYPSDVFAAHEVKSRHFMKTLFQTSAGWSPESTRIGRVIDAVTRPIQVLDIIPMERTSQAAVVYMEETTRTHSSAEKAEAAAYAESAFALTERSSTVRKITDSIPVTDEQLDDVPMVEGYLNNRLQFGVRQRLDGQILTGDGSAPNLAGILNTSGIQTQAKSTDPTPDAIFKAMTKVRVTGRANPNAIVLHPNDWQDIRLLRTADGLYIWGSPSEAGPERIWGLPIVQTDAETENTGLVGDFANFCALFERKGVAVEMGYVNDDFTKGKKTLRAQMRAAFVVFRAAAFCTVTGV